MSRELDRRLMDRAIRLSRRGYPAPNPHVGCVIAQGSQIVGEGYHRRAGEVHAEVAALSQAGEGARGATAYVTLEPCNHHGRTGPCSLALLEAGIRRVVYAVPDPNPIASGGHQVLQKGGVQVEGGLMAEQAAEANQVFLVSEATGRPYVCLKAALSLDGRIALPSGESKWITGPEARRAGHRLRAELGAVLVGPRTVLLDNPALTARFRGAPEIVRVVLDPRGNLPSQLRVFDQQVRTLHIVPPGTQSTVEGVEIPVSGGKFNVDALLKEFKSRGIRGVLVEGGAKTHGEFLAHANRIELFVSGMVLGAGPSWVERAATSTLLMAQRFQFDRIRRQGEDLQLTWLPAKPKASMQSGQP